MNVFFFQIADGSRNTDMRNRQNDSNEDDQQQFTVRLRLNYIYESRLLLFSSVRFYSFYVNSHIVTIYTSTEIVLVKTC